MIDSFLQFIQGTSAALFMTLGFIPAAIGFYLALRCLRFPDLTVEGAFVLGQVTSALFVTEGLGGGWALLFGFLGGSLCGLVTALCHVLLRIPAFVCGIVSTFMVTSVNYKLLQISATHNRSVAEVGEPSELNLTSSGLFQWFYDRDFATTGFLGDLRLWQLGALFLIVVFVSVLTFLFLRSSLGLRLRAFGAHRHAAAVYSAHSGGAIVIGLCVANALVGLSGAVCAQAYRHASIDRGTMLFIPLLAAVVLGEFVVDYLWPRFLLMLRCIRSEQLAHPFLSKPLGLSAAPFCGFLLYNLVFIVISAVVLPGVSENVNAAISSNHKYWITAVLIVAVLVIRRQGSPFQAANAEDVI